MKIKEIYEQFLKVSGLSEEDIVDYRYCTNFYEGIDIPNAITIQMKDGKTIIYKAYDIDTAVKELSETIENEDDIFIQGYKKALEEMLKITRTYRHLI